MRFREFSRRIVEDDSADDNLINVLSLIQYRIEKENLSPDCSTETIINLVRNSGSASFSYGDLVKAFEDNPEVQNIIARPEKNRTEFIPPSETISQDQPDMDLEQPIEPIEPTMTPPESDLGLGTSPSTGGGNIQGPTGDRDTVRSMAKKALSRRK